MSSVHFLLGPFVAFVALGLITLICRWVFSTDDRDARARARLEKAAAGRDYGLLVPVATAATRDDAEMLRDVLRTAGMRSSVTEDLEVLVFAHEAERARRLVS